MVVGVISDGSSIDVNGLPDDAKMVEGGVMRNEPGPDHFARVVIDGEDENIGSVGGRHPEMRTGVVLK